MENLARIKATLDSRAELAISFLERYYDAKHSMFPFTVRLDDRKLTIHGESVRYTLISLIGLASFKKQGVKINIPLDDILEKLTQKSDGIQNIGDIGLLLWAASLLNNEKDLELFYNKLDTNKYINENKAKDLTSLDLEFLLMGLCYICKRLGQSSNVRQQATLIYKELLRNFNLKTGLFCFSRSPVNSKFKHLYNKNMGFFAEQIYGIYSLVNYFELFKDPNTLQKAIQCADTICHLQTEKGEWNWQYNVNVGCVTEKYPVYSVHQDGMAPMVLLRLMKFSGKSYQKNLLKGLDWLTSSSNGLAPLIDQEHNVIWRSMREKGLSKYASVLKKAGILLNLETKSSTLCSSALEIDYETRPYHYGWILQARKEFYDLYD